MAEETSATSHMSDIITATPDDVTHTTGEPVTSSWSRDTAVYFGCAVIVIGIVGTSANGFILYALVASKQHKKHLLIFNQNVLDFASCIYLVITYALKISNMNLTGLVGYYLCMLFHSEALLWSAVEGSVSNLIIISIERYVKVVHPIWSKNKLRNWMIYSSIALCWLFSFVYNMLTAFTTSAVVDGVCHGYIIWEDHVGKVVHGTLYFLWFYVLVLLICVMCYWRILVAILRQARVMTGHNTGMTAQSTAAQAQAHHIQSNVIKTMILVCVFYAMAWLPMNIYYLMANLGGHLTFLDSGYYVVMFVAFLYVCMNPFIYATKFEPVKKHLRRMLLCQKDDQTSHTHTLQTTATHTATRRTFQEHKF